MTRLNLRARGAALRARLHGASEAENGVPGYGDWMDEVAYGGSGAGPVCRPRIAWFARSRR